MRFATSEDRCRILEGWLRYRAALHAAGMTDGFQWLNGSFLEDVESREKRSPRDIDCVTFYRISPEENQEEVFRANPRLFRKSDAKAEFMVDGYFVSLESSDLQLIERSCYWYGVWSHRRNQQWKGFVEIELNTADDEEGLRFLEGRTWKDSS